MNAQKTYVCVTCNKTYIQKKRYETHIIKCCELKKEKCKTNENTGQEINISTRVTDDDITYIDLFAGTGAFSLCFETLKNWKIPTFKNETITRQLM